MEANSDPRAALEQAAAMGATVDTAPILNPEAEQREARRKMSELIDKIDSDEVVINKGVIAYVFGEKDDTGDYRAAVLSEPIIDNENGRHELSYVVLTPDGPKVLDTGQPGGFGATKVLLYMPQDPEDYREYQEKFLKKVRYSTEKFGWPPRIASKLEGRDTFDNPFAFFLTEPGNSAVADKLNVEKQFDKSVDRAGKAVAERKNPATTAIRTADTLSAKL